MGSSGEKSTLATNTMARKSESSGLLNCPPSSSSCQSTCASRLLLLIGQRTRTNPREPCLEKIANGSQSQTWHDHNQVNEKHAGAEVWTAESLQAVTTFT